MNRIIFLLICFTVLFQSCDDGDIIVKSFNFDDAQLKTCGGPNNYVFYKVNTITSTNESLSLKLGIPDSLYKEEGIKEYTLNGSNIFVNYRTYDGILGNNYFCTSIPPISPKVTVEYVANSGTALLKTTFVIEGINGFQREFEFSENDETVLSKDEKTNLATLLQGKPDEDLQLKPTEYKIYKTVQITLKNLVLINGNEKIIVETMNMGTIENVEIITRS